MTSEKPDIKPTATSSGRRTALANWLASPTNPLTARVFVNRVWNQYFGKGIVGDGQRFRQGRRQADQSGAARLSRRSVSSKNGWSVKKLHREILLSAIYRQSSDSPRRRREGRSREQAARRLPAQASRGRGNSRLDPRRLRQAQRASRRPERLPADSRQSHRRQQFQRRSGLDHVEGPEGLHPSQPLHLHAAQRALSAARDLRHGECTAGPQQARRDDDAASGADALQQRDQIFQWSQALAGRVINEAGADESAQLDRLYQILFARKPTEPEKEALHAFLDQHQKDDPAEGARTASSRSRFRSASKDKADRSAARLGLRRSRPYGRELERLRLPLLNCRNITRKET